jgi:hypothetical protein
MAYLSKDLENCASWIEWVSGCKESIFCRILHFLNASSDFGYPHLDLVE